MASTQSTNDQISRSRGLLFDGAVCGVGLALFIVAAVPVAMNGLGPATPAVLGIPLILVVARFPMVVDNRDGGIEVGFDSSVLMFLLCTLDPHDASVRLVARCAAHPDHHRQAPVPQGFQRRRRHHRRRGCRPSCTRQPGRRHRRAPRAGRRGARRRRTSPPTTSSPRCRWRSSPAPTLGATCCSAAPCWRSPASCPFDTLGYLGASSTDRAPGGR